MKPKKNLTFSFDIGHSSIGWAVLSSDKKSGENPFPPATIEGCGSVTFPKDDCLASSRRTHRRMRRNIRATRQRITRLRELILHLGVLSEKELDKPGHPAPFALAAEAITSPSPSLDWQQLWHVIRWYAHNRGYDGNSRWSRQDDGSDDTEKERTALQLMGKHGIDQKSGSMAKTVCAALGINPNGEKYEFSHDNSAYKTLNAAFPRKIVRIEVLNILEKHQGHLKKLDRSFIDTLIAPEGKNEKLAWKTIPVSNLNLPRRYFGGLLFGQLIPRFDNRIIAQCPMSGDKVPNKATKEFLHYRWGMLLSNIRANKKPLSTEERKAVHKLMQKRGRLTPTELRKFVEELTGTTETNIKASFEIHPDSKDALELDPALAFAASAEVNKRNKLHTYWKHLPDIIKTRATGRWKKRRPVTLDWMLRQCAKENYDSSSLEVGISKAFAIDQKKKKPVFLTKEHFLNQRFAPKSLKGRAPYSRRVMADTFDFILSTDRHPAEKETTSLPAGPLYRTKEILAAERNRDIDDLTNNHLIRHRLTILLRLVDDMVEHYAARDTKNVTGIIVEVARDLQEYSGLSAKEMEGELTKRLSHFKAAVKYLEENAPELEINGSLIRKCRIAMDMDWHCPFTGKRYDAYKLKELEREHIIPYADRPTNALDALVLTFDWVNKLKGRRTGLEFIKDMTDDDRFFTPKQYEAFVTKLKVANKDTYPDDYRRQAARKKWLMVEDYEVKDHGFTQGALTQTSHLNRLSSRQLEKKFTDPVTHECSVKIDSIPGAVTAETRKGWSLLGTLAQACPEALHPSIEELEAKAISDAEKEFKKQNKDGTLTEQDREDLIATSINNITQDSKARAGKMKNKTAIRDITHLHHALDAATLAITNHYLPGTFPGQKENEKGQVWKAMLDRNKTDKQIRLLMRTGMFAKHYRKNRNGEYDFDKNGNKKLDVHLDDKKFPDQLKAQLASCLAERRVVQHIPADQSGAALELNQWRVWEIKGDATDPQTPVVLRQQSSIVKDDKRIIKHKEKTERAGKLVGLKDGKLKKNKAALIISENYGLALDPSPEIIPFHHVHQRITTIQQKNDGVYPRILRNGMIIKIHKGLHKGTWKIFSAMASMKLKIASADYPRYDESRPLAKKVSLAPIIKAGLEIMAPPLTGINPED